MLWVATQGLGSQMIPSGVPNVQDGTTRFCTRQAGFQSFFDHIFFSMALYLLLGMFTRYIGSMWFAFYIQGLPIKRLL